MAGKVRYLIWKDDRWAARIAVPVPLRPIIGKTELIETLSTDRREAIRKLAAVVARFQAQIEAAREQTAITTQPTPARAPGRARTLREIARSIYVDELSVHDQLLAQGNPITRSEPDEGYVASLRQIMAGSASNELIADLVGEDLTERNAAPGSEQWRDEGRQIAGVRFDVLRRFDERLNGNFTGTPTHPLLTAPKPAEPTALDPHAARIVGERSRQSVSEIAELMIVEKRASRGTTNEYRVAARMFEEFLGDPRPIYQITYKDVVAYKDALIRTPSNYTKRFKGKPLPQAIIANDKLKTPHPTLDATTINDKWLPRLASIFKWAMNNDVIPRGDNPAAGVKVDRAQSSAKLKRVIFPPEDLSRIFAPPVFDPGKPLGETQWCLLIALHTGWRASEIAQLKIDSVRVQRGVLCFVVEEEAKNEESYRYTPVHSTLIKLGLGDRLAELKRSGHDRLFPEWFAKGMAMKAKPGVVNQPFSQFIPRWFNRTLLREMLKITDSRKVFHCFRHTLKTALELAGVDEFTSDRITGHSESSVAGRYKHDVSVERLRDALEKVHFDGLDLSAHVTAKAAK